MTSHHIGTASPSLRWGEKNRAVKGIFLEHAILVSDIMVAMELACRQAHIRLLNAEELQRDGEAERQLFRWRVNLQNKLKLSVVPDRVFALEMPGPSGSSNRSIFFLEADRGTMPVTRRNFSQTSFYRKLLAYEATWLHGLHRSQFGFNRFRVLTVTTSAARVQSLVEACAQLKSGHGLFLFTDRSILDGDVLRAKWQTGRPGETASLMN